MQKLVRTALFSVLAFLLTGGLMAAQAQTVTVDQDGGEDAITISDGLDQLNTLEGSGGDGEATLQVIAGDYTGSDANVEANRTNISVLNLEILRDQGTVTDQLTIESLNLTGADVNLQSDGNGFLFLQSAGGIMANNGGVDLALQGGTLDIASADLLRFQDADNGSGEVRVFRESGSSISGGAPNYAGDIDLLRYDADGSTVTAGNELGTTAPSSADISRVVDLEVSGNGNVDAVEFPVNSLSVSTFSQSSEENVEVQGDFTVASGGVTTAGNITVTGNFNVQDGPVSVANSSDELEVSGELQIGEDTTTPFLSVTGAINPGSVTGDLAFTSTIDRSTVTGSLVQVGGGAVTFGDVTLDAEATGGGATPANDFIEDTGSGSSVTIDGTLAVNPVSDGNADSDDISEIILADNSSSTVSIGNVTDGSVSDGSNNSDESYVDLQGGSDASITASGDLTDITTGSSNASVTLNSGTTIGGQLDNSANGGVTVSGDVTYNFKNPDFQGGTSSILNGGSGEISVESNQTLTVNVADASGGTVLNNNATGVTGDGTLEFTGSASNIYSVTSGGNNTLSVNSLVTDVRLDIEDASASATNITVSDLTANSRVRFGNSDAGDITAGNVVAEAPINDVISFGRGSNDVGTVSLTSLTVRDDGSSGTTSTVSFASGASVGPVTISDSLRADGEEADFTNVNEVLSGTTANLRVEGEVDINASPADTEVNVAGIETHIEGDFDRDGDPNAIFTTDDDADPSTAVSTVVEFNGTDDAVLSPGSKFTVSGDLVIDKTDVGVTLTEALAVTENVTIAEPESPSAPNNTFTLDDNLFLSGGTAGTVTLDSGFETQPGFFIIVDGSGTKNFQRNTGGATIPNLRISGGTDAQVQTALEFDGTIELRDGGVTVTSGDFAPVADSDAEVRRFLDNSNADITENGGTFNDAGNGYDLSYATIDGTETRPVQNEITDAVEGLTVETGATIELTSTESDSDPVTINDALTVQAGAQISDDGGPRTINLAGSDVTHSVVGHVFGSNTGPVELNVTGSGSTLGGTTSNDPDGDGTPGEVAEIEDLTISGSNNTISDIQQITGNAVVADGSSLTLGLANADESDFANGTFDSDGTIQGNLTVNDTLALATNVEVTSGGAPAVEIDESGSNGRIEFGAWYLYTSNAGDVNGNADATYANNDMGGGFAFGGGGPQKFGTDGVTVPEVKVFSPIEIYEGVDVSDSLDVNANVTLVDNGGNDPVFGTAAGDSLSFSGYATFDGGNIETDGNGEEFISKGTTVELEQNADVANFVVDSGDSETAVTVDDDGTSETLTVDTKFEMRTGDLGQSADIDVTGTDVVYGADAGVINRSSGNLILSSSDKTFALEKDFTIPYLIVDTDVTYGDDENILIGTRLELDNDFEFDGADGKLQITDNSTIVRDDDDGSDVLTEKPVFPSDGQYNVTYNGTSGTHDASYELDNASGTIRNVTVNDGLDVVNTLSGTVTVNGTLSLNAGNVSHGDSGERQIVMADGSTLLRDGGLFSADDAVQHAASDAFYTLEYQNGSLSAADEEFLNTGRVNLVTRIDDGSPSSGDDLNVLPGEDRTVETFLMENGDSDITSLSDGSDGFTLTVTDTTALNGGQLDGSGTLDANDNVEVNGATVASNVNAAGNFIFNSGSLDEVDLAFDGSSDQRFQLANSAEIGELTLGQQGGSVSDPLQVEFDGPPLGIQDQLTLNSGLLVVDDPQDPDDNNEFIAVSQTGPGDPFGGTTTSGAAIVHDPNDGTLSHVVGKFQHGIKAGTPTQTDGQGRFEWPVGSMTEYRPASVTFTDSDPIDTRTNIRIRHVNEGPRGTGGLGNISGIGSYPQQYWDVEATTGVSTSQTFDLQFETGTAGFVDQFDNADNLRIIRRFDGNVEQNDWLLQGSQDSYQNALFTSNQKQFTSVRSNSSQGGLVTQGTRFTLGLPSRMPAFLASSFEPSDLTINEGETLTASFLASSQDLDQSLTALDTTSVPADAREFVTTEGFETDSTTTDSVEVAFSPDQSFVSGSTSRTVDLTVQAEDADGSVDSTFTVTVNNVTEGPAIADAPDAPVAVQDTGRTAPAVPATFEVTGVITDPDGGPLSFATNAGWATVDSTYSAGEDTTTAVIALTPGFPEAQDAVSGPLSLQVEATDEGTSLSTNTSVDVDVNFDRLLGDPSGDGQQRVDDAVLALDIAVGKSTIDGESVLDSQIRAADVVTPSEGDTTDAVQSDVRADDAFTIFNTISLSGVASKASASAASANGSQTGEVYLGEPEVKNGVASYPVMLTEDAAGTRAADVTLSVDKGEVKGVKTQLAGDWMGTHNITDGGTVKLALIGKASLAGQQVATVTVETDGGLSDVKPSGKYRLNGGSKKSLGVRAAPDQFALKGSYPNPVSSGEATIEMDLPSSTTVTVEVYNVLGQRVQTIEQTMSAGKSQTVKVDASTLSSGQYFYRIKADLDGKSVTETQRITVVR